MEVEFQTNRLQRCYQDFARGSKLWGPKIARVYIGRVGTILAARHIGALYTIRSLRLHPLKGRREGQLAIDLDGQWRMIITHIEAEAKVVVMEVTNHYDD